MAVRMMRRRLVKVSALAAMAAVYGPAFTQRRAPYSRFDKYSTAEEVTEGIDLTGMTAVVTGCNSGIGLETTRVLALRGAHVIGTARSVEKGEAAAASVVGKVTPLVLELSEFDTVVECAEQIQAMNVPIDMLIMNAGVLTAGVQQIRGLEMQFVVNHLGHFVLGNRLMNRVIEAPEGRVVVVGSGAHLGAPDGGIQFHDLSGESWKDESYEHSKLANGLYSLELSKRLADTSATSNSLHPGGVQTGILRNLGIEIADFPKTVEQGAATQCYVATNPALSGVTGQYFSDCNPSDQSAYQKDEVMAARLWEVSEELTRDYLIG